MAVFFLNKTTYQQWFRIFLPVIFKYTISVPCLSIHRDNKFTKFYRQKQVTNVHLEMGHY